MFVIGSIIFFVNMFINTEADTSKIESSTLINRVLFGISPISYCDKIINRCYPGIIDYNIIKDKSKLDKLTSEYLKVTPDYGQIALKGDIELEGSNSPFSFYLNKNNYDSWYYLTYSSKYVLVEKEYNILAFDNYKFTPGKIKMNFIMRVG